MDKMSLNYYFFINESGFMPPTKGTAFINGFNIRQDMDNIRQSLGLCPQFNILFDVLTVEEHLQFFSEVN